MRPEDPITASIHDRDGAAVLKIRGEIDVASAPAFKSAISEALALRPQMLVIDLTDVDFFGSVGVSILLEAQDKVAEHGLFGVVARGPFTGRVIQLVGLQDVLSVYQTVDEALGARTAG